MGLFFQNVQNVGCLPSQILKNGPIIISREFLEMGTFFGKNDPLKRVRVSRLRRHIPVQVKSEYRGGFYSMQSEQGVAFDSIRNLNQRVSK